MKTISESIPFVGSNLREPLDEACQEITSSIGKPSFVLMAWSGSIDCLALQKHSREIFPCPFIGVHTDGFFTNSRLETDGIGLWAVSGDNINARTLLLENPGRDSWSEGEKAASFFAGTTTEKGLFLHFPEVFSFDVHTFLRGFHGNIGPVFRHIGGGINAESAGGCCFFTEQGAGKQGGAIAFLEGLSPFIDAGHGFHSIGGTMIITRAEGRRIIELDYLPAAEKYLETTGKDTIQTHEVIFNYPLGLPGRQNDFLVRKLLEINDNGELLCLTEIPELSPVSVMYAEPEDLIQSTQRLCRRIRNAAESGGFTLVFDCVSRRNLLGEKIDDELDIITGSCSFSKSLWGMLSFGEICDAWGSPVFMNKTLAIARGNLTDE